MHPIINPSQSQSPVGIPPSVVPPSSLSSLSSLSLVAIVPLVVAHQSLHPVHQVEPQTHTALRVVATLVEVVPSTLVVAVVAAALVWQRGVRVVVIVVVHWALLRVAAPTALAAALVGHVAAPALLTTAHVVASLALAAPLLLTVLSTPTSTVVTALTLAAPLLSSLTSLSTLSTPLTSSTIVVASPLLLAVLPAPASSIVATTTKLLPSVVASSVLLSPVTSSIIGHVSSPVVIVVVIVGHVSTPLVVPSTSVIGHIPTPLPTSVIAPVVPTT